MAFIIERGHKITKSEVSLMFKGMSRKSVVGKVLWVFVIGFLFACSMVSSERSESSIRSKGFGVLGVWDYGSQVCLMDDENQC